MEERIYYRPDMEDKNGGSSGNNTKPTFSRRAFLRAAGATIPAILLGGSQAPSPEGTQRVEPEGKAFSSESKDQGYTKSAPEGKDATLDPVVPTEAPEAVGHPAEPVKETGAIPENQVNKNFMLGEITLEQSFSIVLEDPELAKASNREPGYTATVNPIPVHTKDPNELSDIRERYNTAWEETPGVAQVLRGPSYAGKHNLLRVHSAPQNLPQYEDLNLPGDPFQNMYDTLESQGKLTDSHGKTFTITQVRDGRNFTQQVKIIDMRSVPNQDVSNAYANYSDKPEEPIFVDFEKLLPKDVIGTPEVDRLTITTCRGERLGGDEGTYAERLLLTVEAV